MRRSTLGALTLAAVAMACDSATGPRTDLLEVRASPFGLVLENRTEEPVYYFAWAVDPRREIEYSLCTDQPVTCSSVPARGSVSIPYSQIHDYDFGDTEANVGHWRLVPGTVPGTLRATDVRGLTFRLY